MNRGGVAAPSAILTAPRSHPNLGVLIRSQTRRFVWYHRVRNAAIIASQALGANVAANSRWHAGSGLRGSHQLGKTPIRPFPTRIHLQTFTQHYSGRVAHNLLTACCACATDQFLRGSIL